LQNRHSLIGDVRGLGLFIGVEFVRNQEQLEPADSEAAQVVERMKERGILLSTDGPFHNVIKIKPPLVFSRADADFLLSGLDSVLNQ
jgi:4-aminobutyrate aminotransferase-like enzyme